LLAQHEAGFQLLMAERAEFLRHAMLFALEGGFRRCGRSLRAEPSGHEVGAERGEPESDDDHSGKSRTDADEDAFHGWSFHAGIDARPDACGVEPDPKTDGNVSGKRPGNGPVTVPGRSNERPWTGRGGRGDQKRK